MLTEYQNYSSDGVTVVAPAYNEEAATSSALKQLRGVAKCSIFQNARRRIDNTRNNYDKKIIKTKAEI